MIGRTLSHFRITTKLGEGGMGEVYRATDSKLGREVAVKVLLGAYTEDPQRLARFEREARTLAALNHPNIAAIHEVGDQEGIHYLVMELVAGETLAKRLERGPVPLKSATVYALQCARALEAAHRQGFLHRDLKPLNVKITPEGEIKLLDFGLAKSFTSVPQSAGVETDAVTAEAELTATGTIVGTASYMSPEQIRGESVDQRTDIWAFGCVLFQMLTGRGPFQRQSRADTLAAILKEEVDLSQLPADTPESLRALIERCLRKQTARRLHHIADARIELEETLERLDGSESATGPDTAPSVSRPKRPEGRSSRVRLLAGLALVALVAVAAWHYLPLGKEQHSVDRSIAVLPFDTLGQSESTVFTEGIHGDMLTRLSKVADLEVTSRTSVLQFRDSEAPVSTIARQLGVSWILRGEVQRLGEQVQVNARLVDVRRDRQVWAETYRRELTPENLFEIQGELTREIVEQLAARLSPAEERSVGHVPTEDLEAYRAYVQGRALVEQRTDGELRRAVEYFREAIERDSEYALAWAGLADALSLQGYYDYVAAEFVLPQALEAAERAVEVDPELAEAHASLGIVQAVRQHGPVAVEELNRALDRNPSYAEAYAWLGWLHDALGNPEMALEAAQRSVELNPLAPAYRAFLAEAYLANGGYERALREARRARELQPEYALAHYFEGLVLFHLRRLDEAEQALRRSLDLALPDGTPSLPAIQAARALVRARTGDIDGTRALLQELDADRYPFEAALGHAALGEIDRSLRLMSLVSEWGFSSTPQVRYFFPEILDPLRRRPEFEPILEQVDRSWGLDHSSGTSPRSSVSQALKSSRTQSADLAVLQGRLSNR